MRFCVTLKAIAINIFRATAVRKAINVIEGTPAEVQFSLYRTFFVFKEHFGTILNRLRNVFTPFAYMCQFELKMAA